MSRLFVSLLVFAVVAARKRSSCCCCHAWIHPLAPYSIPTTTRSTIRTRTATTTTTTTTTLFQQAHRKFAQPNFSSSSTNRSSSASSSTTTTSPSPSSSTKRSRNNSNSLLDIHTQRLQMAGRIGTKRYVNPTKLFVGNLSYNVTESMLQEWICQQLGVPPSVAIHSTHIVRDWKTSSSKGYGFVEFTEPIYATVCLNKWHNGVEWMGRKISVGQGKKKEQDPIVYIKRNKDSERDDDTSKAAQQVRMTPEEQAMLRHLDPDLLEEYLVSSGPEDDELDEELLEDVDDDIDDYEDVEDSAPNQLLPPQNNNRAQRRQAERINNKKKKPSNKGFGV